MSDMNGEPVSFLPLAVSLNGLKRWKTKTIISKFFSPSRHFCGLQV